MGFFFAWVDPGDTTFSATFERNDEEVFSFEIAHAEGEFPALSIDILNPKVGLLNAGRKVWAWLSYDDGSTDATPLFFGRLVGIPEQLQDEIVRLAFVGRPLDWDAQKQALAATMRVAPYYDPIWIAEDKQDDPDAVLEGYASLWHIDRVTHVVTASSITTGEDGTVDFNGSFFYDSLEVGIGSAPARRIEVEAKVFWDQTASGSVDITSNLISAFRDAGTSRGGVISSYTGEGLMRDWPPEGRNIGSGWEVGTSIVKRVDGRSVPREFRYFTLEDASRAQFPIWTIRPTFHVNYDISRARTEILTFTLEADVQAILTEPGDEDVIRLTLSSQDVGSAIDPADSDNPDGALPIGDLRRRAYFPTDRGRDSVEVLISLARAQLLMRARSVDVSFAVPFEDALTLSCRKNATVDDDRLPGGTATGKIVAYSLSCDGDRGTMEATVTIGCTIGQGATVSTVAGTPVYVVVGYVDEGYQLYTGMTVAPIAGEVTYEEFGGTEPVDDGVDFFAMTPAAVIESLTVINGVTVQEAALDTFLPDLSAAAEAVNAVYTEVDLTLVPLAGGPFETTYALTVSDLMVPRTINLEAA